MQQHIGVGAATRIDEMRIRWPASWEHEQVFSNLDVDKEFAVKEGGASVEVIPRKTLLLGASPMPAHSMH